MSRNHRNRKRGWIQKKQEANVEIEMPLEPLEGPIFDLETIKFALSNHPADCIFELGAPEKIYQRLKGHTIGYWFDNLKEFRNCFIQSEIYCPHEGIDRRAEYSMEVE